MSPHRNIRKSPSGGKPGRKAGLAVRGAGELRVDNMAYKIPMECMFTAIYYGSSHNRHDLYTYDEATRVLTLTGLKVTPEQSSHVVVAEYNIETGVFTALVWDDVVRSLKQTVSQFLLSILSVFDVEDIAGPPAFMAKWEKRIDMRKKLRSYQAWVGNDCSNEGG